MTPTKPSGKLRPTSGTVFKAMGDDLVAVNESAGTVAVLNATARKILEGLVQGKSDRQIAASLRRSFTVKASADLAKEIDAVRSRLVKAKVLAERLPFASAKVSVKDLRTALREIDLSKSEVSQVE